MDMKKYHKLVAKFGEGEIICGNCLNWHNVEHEGLEKVYGICMANCFRLNTTGINVVLLSHFSSCYSNDAVKQNFIPNISLVAKERIETTLRRLDAELRREAAKM